MPRIEPPRNCNGCNGYRTPGPSTGRRPKAWSNTTWTGGVRLSEYGRTNHLEGYAEAYAEWSLTGGKSTNAAASMYAETLGWKVKG